MMIPQHPQPPAIVSQAPVYDERSGLYLPADYAAGAQAEGQTGVRSNLPNIWKIDEETGRLVLSLHPGQVRAWNSRARFIAVLAGTQGGKTSYAPWWLAREIELTASPEGKNDYLAVTSTFDLFKLKFLPVMLECFVEVLGIGRYWASDRLIELSDPATGEFWASKAADVMWGRIILRAAVAGSGLESATARAAVLDEAGQDEYTIETWEAVRRRLSLFQGRALLPTTVYSLGWLKIAVYDRWKRHQEGKGQPGDDEFDVQSFDSIENPAFPEVEFYAAKASMPAWRFDMMYRGKFTRPAGQIYHCFVDDYTSVGGHKVRTPRTIPDHWHRGAGGDFGVRNTCVGLYALEEDDAGYPTGQWIRYRSYFAGGKDAIDHVAALKEMEPRLKFLVGGAPSEDAWRSAWTAAGLPTYAPYFKDVEAGIDRVYGGTSRHALTVMDTDTTFIDQKMNYSRELDDMGEPTLAIKDKEKYHHLDTERYFSIWALPVKGLLPWRDRKHLMVGRLGKGRLPSSWARVGGIQYQDGSGFSAAVILTIDPAGDLIQSDEVIVPGLESRDFALAVRQKLEDCGINDLEDVLFGCNPEMFVPRQVDGRITGPEAVEAFREAGLSCVQVRSDGINEWATLRDRMVSGAGGSSTGFRVQRGRCPFTALTLPRIVPDVEDARKPDPKGPICAGQAICWALATQPEAAFIEARVRDVSDQSHLPPQLRTDNDEHYRSE